MKCPKCHYLSFDPEPRCRNCGYTLEFDADLAMHPETEDAAELPLADFELRREAPAHPAGDATRAAVTGGTRPPVAQRPEPVVREPAPAPVVDPKVLEPAPPASPPRTKRQPPPSTTELPLFVRRAPAVEESAIESEATGQSGGDTSEPVAIPAAPPPVRVRRTSAAAHPPERKLGPLDHDLLEGLERLEHQERRSAAGRGPAEPRENRAGAGRRLVAAACDSLLLTAIAAVIVAMALQGAGLAWEEWSSLPLVPLAAFMLMIVVAYLFMFTVVSGQTAGKMAMKIRVVGEGGSPDEPLSAGQALVRAIVTIPSVLLAGIGFLPALTGEQRAVHDRVAGTRVVRE